MKQTVKYLIESYRMLSRLSQESTDHCTRCEIKTILDQGRLATAELENHSKERKARNERV